MQKYNVTTTTNCHKYIIVEMLTIETGALSVTSYWKPCSLKKKKMFQKAITAAAGWPDFQVC